MKTNIIITIENDKKNPENMDVKYARKDLEKPKTKDESLILSYIEGLVRFTIDNGFAPAQKGNDDGTESSEPEKPVSD